MKPACDFFSPEERSRIEVAVRAAEATTSGEIVPMVIDASSDYPRSELIGGASLALAVAALISWGYGHESIWWFLPLFIGGIIPFQQLIRRLPGLKRRLINPAELTAEVREQALVCFLEQELHHTRERTGVLILISLFEHRVQVLADSGINDRVPEHTWEEIVAIITAGLKTDAACDAVCNAVERCGKLLSAHFPAQRDDSDELPNLIIAGETRTAQPTQSEE